MRGLLHHRGPLKVEYSWRLSFRLPTVPLSFRVVHRPEHACMLLTGLHTPFNLACPFDSCLGRCEWANLTPHCLYSKLRSVSPDPGLPAWAHICIQCMRDRLLAAFLPVGALKTMRVSHCGLTI